VACLRAGRHRPSRFCIRRPRCTLGSLLAVWGRAGAWLYGGIGSPLLDRDDKSLGLTRPAGSVALQ